MSVYINLCFLYEYFAVHAILFGFFSVIVWATSIHVLLGNLGCNSFLSETDGWENESNNSSERQGHLGPSGWREKACEATASDI